MGLPIPTLDCRHINPWQPGSIIQLTFHTTATFFGQASRRLWPQSNGNAIPVVLKF